MPRKARRPAAGFTLVELVIFIVVVGVGLAGVLAVLNFTAARSADPLPVKQSLAVAESFLEEILLKAYANPGGGFTGAASQANRAQFDDVSDFHGYDQTGVYSVSGATALPGLESYRVQVSVAAATLNAVPARLITVTVTDPSGQSHVLSGYRTDYDFP